MKNNRRDFIKKSASLTAALSVSGLGSCTGPVTEDSDSGTLQNVPRRKYNGPLQKVRILQR